MTQHRRPIGASDQGFSSDRTAVRRTQGTLFGYPGRARSQGWRLINQT
jgi:hypothetical protein